MADIIKLLPDHVANQIAAGEVVQRPASVVKELLENAIDAGATEVKLIIKEAGKTLVQVIDNGKGMSDTDARLSFERHATSKISTAEDLFDLNTKGFRGEALASIGAIAHVEMNTKQAGNDVGTLIKMEGSVIVAQDITVVPNGTSVAVKNLFFNIPARRNFLKSDQVELRHIIDEFHRVSLAHPEIHFIFFNNSSELYNLPQSNLRKRIVNVFGDKTNERLVPITEDTAVVTVQGFVCKPNFAKKSRGEQFFFVNGRFIKSPYLHHAVVSAFEGLIKEQHYPRYYIYLTVDPSTLDINIHPTKTEIKFDDEHTLYAILKSTVKHSLGQFSVAPTLDFNSNTNLDTPYGYQNKVVGTPQVEVDSSFNPFREESIVSKAVSGGGFKKANSESWEGIYSGLKEETGIESDFGSVQFESEEITGKLFSEEEDKHDSAASFQLRKKYIITHIKSGMIIIDQQRAHQRVLYERFLKNITVQEAVSQQLLFPLELSFSTADIAIVKEIQNSLEHVGFMFEAFKEDVVVVSGIPVMVVESEVSIIIEQLIVDVQQEFVEDSFSQTDILAKALCKSLAVKTGEFLTNESQVALINDLFACKEAMVSPFNKPIYITTTVDELDKRFL